MSMMEYRGFALAEREQNLYHDSYFHITVWNPETAEPESFEYAATAHGGSYPLSPESRLSLLESIEPAVKSAYERWQERANRRYAFTMLQLDFERGKVFKGDRVRVARGRKVPRGLEGTVMSVETRVTHTSKYGTWQTKEDFALVACGTGYWTVNAKNLDIIERGPVMQELFDLAC
jgi:hypothetical protein